MKKYLFLLLQAALFCGRLAAQENFEGRISYQIKKFTSENGSTPDSFNIWFGGNKLKLTTTVRNDSGSLSGVMMLWNFESGKMYIQAPPLQKIMVVPLSIMQAGWLPQQEKQPQYTGDSMIFFGTPCYKYLLDTKGSIVGGGSPGTAPAGWYSASHLFTPAAGLTGLPFVNAKGQIMLKSESFTRPGVYNTVAYATEIIPGKPEAHFFDIDESNIDSTMAKLMGVMSDTAKAAIKMPADEDLTEIEAKAAAIKKQLKALERKNDIRRRGAYVTNRPVKKPVKKLKKKK